MSARFHKKSMSCQDLVSKTTNLEFLAKILFLLDFHGKISFDFPEKEDYARFRKKSGHKQDLAWSCKILQDSNHWV